MHAQEDRRRNVNFWQRAVEEAGPKRDLEKKKLVVRVLFDLFVLMLLMMI
jgi:hypothetical protein